MPAVDALRGHDARRGELEAAELSTLRAMLGQLTPVVVSAPVVVAGRSGLTPVVVSAPTTWSRTDWGTEGKDYGQGDFGTVEIANFLEESAHLREDPRATLVDLVWLALDVKVILRPPCIFH